jgi:N-terminal acetyltransferase B complex non-catalytic subunit
LVVKAEAAIHQQAKDVKRTLNQAGVLGTLVEVTAGRSGDGSNHQSKIGEALEKQGDAARHETFCGDMKESWEDAVDGILACKIKIFK